MVRMTKQGKRRKVKSGTMQEEKEDRKEENPVIEKKDSRKKGKIKLERKKEKGFWDKET